MVFGLIFAPKASAHIDLVETTPTREEIVPTTPEEITLTFNTDVNPETLKIDLYYRDGTNYPFISENGAYFTVNEKTVTVKPPSLDQGTYIITFSSSGPDGHISADQFHFSVGAPSGPAGDLRTQSPIFLETLQTLSRWLLYLVFSLGFGLVFYQKFGTKLLSRTAANSKNKDSQEDSGATIPNGDTQTGSLEYEESQKNKKNIDKLLNLVFIIALPLVAIRLLIVGFVVGQVSGFSQISTIFTTFASSLGWILLLAAGVLFLLKQKIPNFFPVAVFALILFALGDSLTGHLPYQNQGNILVILASLHLLGVLLWIGLPSAFILKYKLTKNNLISFFKQTTIILSISAVLVVTTGPLMFLIRTGGVNAENLTTSYGVVVLAKTLIVTLTGLAGLIHIIKRRKLAHNSLNDTPDTSNLSNSNKPQTKGDDLNVKKGETAKTINLIGSSFKTEIILLSIAALLGAFLAGLNPKPVPPSSTDLLAAPTSYEECMGKEDEASKFLCVSKYYENIAVNDSVSKAIAEFSGKWQDNDQWIQTNCHQIGHKLGRIGWGIYGNIKDAFAQGSDPCDYGYLHGVIEGASAGFTEEQLLESMLTMCEDIPGGMTDHTYRQCIHGLGHAAARRVNNDVPKAMEYCRVFYKEGLQENTQSDLDWYKFNLCVTGISMEWNISPLAYETATKEIGESGTLLYECGQVDKIFASGCIEYATTPFAGQVDKLVEILDWCVKNLEDPYPCYLSVGRDVMVPWVDYKEVLTVCESQGVSPEAEQCVIRAMGNIATRELSAEAIQPLCDVLPARYDNTCVLVKNAMAKQLEQMTKGYIIESDS